MISDQTGSTGTAAGRPAAGSRGARIPASGAPRALLLLLLGAVVAPGCGIFGGGGNAPQAGEPAAGRVTLVANERLNTCGGDLSNALAVRVYQLSATANASVVPQARLWEADEEELGDQLLFRRELFLNPGSRETAEIAPRPGAQHLMVAGNFCLTGGDCWRWIGPLPKAGASLTLWFGEDCVATTEPADGAGE